jgi:hypothetical protein
MIVSARCDVGCTIVVGVGSGVYIIWKTKQTKSFKNIKKKNLKCKDNAYIYIIHT